MSIICLYNYKIYPTPAVLKLKNVCDNFKQVVCHKVLYRNTRRRITFPCRNKMNQYEYGIFKARKHNVQGNFPGNLFRNKLCMFIMVTRAAREFRFQIRVISCHECLWQFIPQLSIYSLHHTKSILIRVQYR